MDHTLADLVNQSPFPDDGKPGGADATKPRDEKKPSRISGVCISQEWMMIMLTRYKI